MRVEITTTGVAPGGGEDVIGIAYGNLTNFAPALHAVAEAYRARERRVFATANGGAWAALDRATVRRKGNARVLVETGELMRSLTSASDGGHIERISGNHLTVSTHNLKAHWADIGYHGPPRSPSPEHTEAEIGAYADIILGYVAGAENGSAPAPGMIDLGSAISSGPARAAIGA